MTQASVPAPSIKLTSFACPHCGAHATQTWFRTRLENYGNTHPVPVIWPLEDIEETEIMAGKTQNITERTQLQMAAKHFRKILQGEPFFGLEQNALYGLTSLENISVSRCYTCGKPSIWLHDGLLYPPVMTGPSPNPDLSEDVLHDYEEARKILDLSPRGAAALLRLAIEKICLELGAEGNGIDKQIAYLVSKGLPEAVQQALDTVRVIGNEAIHPGQLNLRDDRETASQLFGLVNFIAEDRITRPKQISALYSMIPEGKRNAIDARNAQATDNQ